MDSICANLQYVYMCSFMNRIKDTFKRLYNILLLTSVYSNICYSTSSVQSKRTKRIVGMLAIFVN